MKLLRIVGEMDNFSLCCGFANMFHCLFIKLTVN